MKALKNMIQIAKEMGVHRIKPEGMALSARSAQRFFEAARDCAPFVVTRSLWNEVAGSKDVNEITDKLAAPFPVFSFELVYDDGSTGVIDISIDNTPVALLCAVDSGDYIYILTVNDQDDYAISEVERARITPENFNEILNLVSFFVGLLQLQKFVGKETISEKVSYKPKGSKKKKHIIKDTVFIISPKSQRESFGSRNIDWSHRWQVRGHWRHYKDPGFVGFDEEGNFGVRGKTWVAQYEKGEGDLIKKTRIIKEEK